jgi:hypothetical protein
MIGQNEKRKVGNNMAFKFHTQEVFYSKLADALNDLVSKGFEIYEILDTDRTSIKLIVYIKNE